MKNGNSAPAPNFSVKWRATMEIAVRQSSQCVSVSWAGRVPWPGKRNAIV
jgi:hypothetical protein